MEDSTIDAVVQQVSKKIVKLQIDPNSTLDKKFCFLIIWKNWARQKNDKKNYQTKKAENKPESKINQ